MSKQILLLDNGGVPHSWTSWEDAICLKVKGAIAWEFGDATKVYNGGISRLTGLRSQVEVAPIIALKGKFKHDYRTPPLTNDNLFQRDLNICAYCGRHYRTDKLSRDHIQPVSKGGPNTWQNCVTACKSCNHEKADMTLEQAGMKLLYVPYVPSHVERLILSNRNIISDQMDFLKTMLPEHSRILTNRLPI